MKEIISKAVAEVYYDSIFKILESLEVVHSSGDDRKIITKPHLQIRHTKSGLAYTVDSGGLNDYNNPVISCYRFTDDGNRKYAYLGKDDFKDYERV